jgi:hypothetical protein
MLAAILTAGLQAVVAAPLACEHDLAHCAGWRGEHCVDVDLRPACETTRGWHEFVPGVPVCTVECPDGRPTS